jgi:hypothetical protein
MVNLLAQQLKILFFLAHSLLFLFKGMRPQDNLWALAGLPTLQANEYEHIGIQPSQENQLIGNQSQVNHYQYSYK